MLFRLLVVFAATIPGFGGEVVVRVGGVKTEGGEIGCSLFSSEKGFPMDASVAKSEWQPGRPGAVCRFSGLPAGNYAVGVSLDRNGNRKVDTGIFGIPKEDWGVSQNVRPRMRAPKFAEAQFRVEQGQTVTLDVEVGR